MSVSPQRGDNRQHRLPDQVNSENLPLLWCWSDEEREKTQWEKLWLDVSENNWWALRFLIKIWCNCLHIPITKSPLQITSCTCLNCNTSKMTNSMKTNTVKDTFSHSSPFPVLIPSLLWFTFWCASVSAIAGIHQQDSRTFSQTCQFRQQAKGHSVMASVWYKPNPGICKPPHSVQPEG